MTILDNEEEEVRNYTQWWWT